MATYAMNLKTKVTYFREKPNRIFVTVHNQHISAVCSRKFDIIYQTISIALDIPRTTVKTVVNKRRKCGTAVTLSRTGHFSKFGT